MLPDVISLQRRPAALTPAITKNSLRAFHPRIIFFVTTNFARTIMENSFCVFHLRMGKLQQFCENRFPLLNLAFFVYSVLHLSSYLLRKNRGRYRCPSRGFAISPDNASKINISHVIVPRSVTSLKAPNLQNNTFPSRVYLVYCTLYVYYIHRQKNSVLAIGNESSSTSSSSGAGRARNREDKREMAKGSRRAI